MEACSEDYSSQRPSGRSRCPFTHPFGNVKEERRILALFASFERACQNCHSERTQWPAYSNLPRASRASEKDVAEGRAHLDFSHWNDYSTDDKRDLLARIGALVRNRQMPLPALCSVGIPGRGYQTRRSRLSTNGRRPSAGRYAGNKTLGWASLLFRAAER
jgi:hypothetical protein